MMALSLSTCSADGGKNILQRTCTSCLILVTTHAWVCNRSVHFVFVCLFIFFVHTFSSPPYFISISICILMIMWGQTKKVGWSKHFLIKVISVCVGPCQFGIGFWWSRWRCIVYILQCWKQTQRLALAVANSRSQSLGCEFIHDRPYDLVNPHHVDVFIFKCVLVFGLLVFFLLPFFPLFLVVVQPWNIFLNVETFGRSLSCLMGSNIFTKR